MVSLINKWKRGNGREKERKCIITFFFVSFWRWCVVWGRRSHQQSSARWSWKQTSMLPPSSSLSTNIVVQRHQQQRDEALLRRKANSRAITLPPPPSVLSVREKIFRQTSSAYVLLYYETYQLVYVHTTNTRPRKIHAWKCSRT